MAYATTDDVQACFAGFESTVDTISSSSTPTDAQVEAWLDQYSAVVDGYLARHGVTVPLTSYAAVTPFVAQRVAVDVWTAGGNRSAEEPAFITRWMAAWRSFLADVKAGDVPVAGITPTSSTIGVGVITLGT